MNAGRWLPACAFALIAVALLALRPAPTPGPLLRDFEAYWGAGATWNAHADPYGRAIWNAERGVAGVDARRDEVLPFVGPPATLLVWSAFARLPYAVAARLWAIALALAILALAAAAIRGSATGIRFTSVFAAIALAIAFGPVTSDVALGQVALVAFLGATVVALPVNATLASLAGVAAFFQPNVALGVVSQIGRNRTTLALAFAALLTYAAGALASGPRWPVDYGQRLLAHEGVERLSAIQLTPAAIAHGAGASPAFTAFIAAVSAIAAIAAAFFIWRRVRDPFARFAAFAPLAPFVASFFHEHDLVVGYVAAVWCGIHARGTARSIALAGTLLVAIDWLGLAQRPSGILQSALLALAAACAFTALADRPEWRATAAVVGLAAVAFAFAACLAAGHSAPIWPDALGNFHAPPSASLAEVWHDEQARSGLTAVNPTWAFLRSLSIAGCALLSLAAFLNARSSVRSAAVNAAS